MTVRLFAAPVLVTLTVCVRGSPTRRVPKSVGPSIVAVVRRAMIGARARQERVAVPALVVMLSGAVLVSGSMVVGEKPTWMVHEPPAPSGLLAQPLFRMVNEAGWPVAKA